MPRIPLLIAAFCAAALAQAGVTASAATKTHTKAASVATPTNIAACDALIRTAQELQTPTCVAVAATGKLAIKPMWCWRKQALQGVLVESCAQLFPNMLSQIQFDQNAWQQCVDLYNEAPTDEDPSCVQYFGKAFGKRVVAATKKYGPANVYDYMPMPNGPYGYTPTK